jgi:dynactin 1
MTAEFEKPPENVGERSSLAFVQLEKHNERLKDALIRLRDMTSETERDQRNRISELERDLSETSGLQGQSRSLSLIRAV